MRIAITNFDTERNYDCVDMLAYPDDESDACAHLSGTMSDISHSFTVPRHDIAVRFTSDESVHGNSFELGWTCQGGH